jgi:hypothetical protein
MTDAKGKKNYARTRVLSKHVSAVKAALAQLPELVEGGQTSDDIAKHIATAVLTAYDDQMKYVIATDDRIAFGPFPNRTSAKTAIAKGHVAYRRGQRMMVLPMRPVPRKRGTSEFAPTASPPEQLALWDEPERDDLGNLVTPTEGESK